jgi:hypothetical protein
MIRFAKARGITEGQQSLMSLKLSPLPFYLGILFAAILAGAKAQDFGAVARSMPRLSMVLTGLYPPNSNFSADAEIQMKATGSSSMVIPMRFVVSGSHMRNELDAPRWPVIPPETGKAMTSLKVDQIVFVTRLDRKKVSVLFPRIQAFFEEPIPDSAIEEARIKSEKTVLTKTALGEEQLDGQRCTKTKVTASDAQDEAATVWLAQDIQFPVKIEVATPNGTTTVLFKNVKLGAAKDSDFELPPNYTRRKNADEITQLARELFARSTPGGGGPGLK